MWRSEQNLKQNLTLFWGLLLACLALAGSHQASAQDQKAPAAESSTKQSADSHLSNGYEALRQDRYDVAVQEFRAALEINPKLTLRARFPLAVALFEMKKPEDSRREFEAVQREVGDHPNVSYYLGRLDLEDQNFEGAIQKLTQAMEKPPFPDTSYYLGYAYFKHGDLAEAEKWLKQAAEAIPNDARVPYQLGLVLRKEGKEEEAKTAMAQSSEQRKHDSSQSELRVACAQELEKGTREEAHAVCDQLYDPNSAENLTALGTLYARNGDVEAALKPLTRAAELSPQSPQMQYNLALAYFQLGRFQDARAPLASALARWPDIFQLNALNGAVLAKLGEDLRAYEALRHAHELNQQDAATSDLLYLTTLSLARKARNAGHNAESLRYLEEIAKLKPQEPEPHRSMAEIYKATGRPTMAAKEQKEAERLEKEFTKSQ
jgi:tetratricopeptide (TPR) repeat protein